jgi:hypothetical protein
MASSSCVPFMPLVKRDYTETKWPEVGFCQVNSTTSLPLVTEHTWIFYKDVDFNSGKPTVECTGYTSMSKLTMANDK